MQPEIRIEICDDPDTVITNEKASSLIKKASNSTLFDLNSIDALKSSHPEFHNIFQDSSTQIKCPICKQKLSNNTISLDKLKPRFLGHLKSIFTFELSDLSIRGIDHLI